MPSLKFILVVEFLLSLIVIVGVVWWMATPKTWDVSFEERPAATTKQTAQPLSSEVSSLDQDVEQPVPTQ